MSDLFVLQTPLWELVLRGTVVYLAISVLMRVIPKRHAGKLSQMDLIALVIVGDLAGYAIVGDDTATLDVLVMVAIVLIWSYLVNVIEYYVPRLRHVSEHSPTLLIHDGRILKENLRKEKITEEELRATLRKCGVDSVERVRLGVLEVDGEISVVEMDGSSADSLEL